MNKEAFKFVDLNRRFRKLDPHKNPEDAAIDSYTASLLGHDTGLGWKELFEHHLVVVLGEPGSGKTREFQERAKILQSQGKLAFFVPLDRLINQSIGTILAPEENKQFQYWLNSNHTVTFLLDSVDEAKYLKASDFLAALDRFRNAVGSKDSAQMHILVSSRISEWQPQSDAYELTRRFPQPPRLKLKDKAKNSRDSEEIVKEQDTILIVQLEPLDKIRVEQFTRERGIVDSSSFIQALDDNFAWPLVRRPIDVVDIINYWKTHNRLGNLTELIEYDLDQKLRETVAREVQDPLTQGKARQGAETLGAATALCRQFNFYVPDDSYLINAAAIVSAACLPEDWRPDERRALLNRAIFDSASYGQIRFHHRRVAEYLAAQWFTTRMQEGCTIPILQDLLFTTIGNELVIRPSLAAVTAWLCSGESHWNEAIRSNVLKAAPGIHLQYGDPSHLPLAYKRQLLTALVQRYEGRKHVRINTETDALSRLADSGLAGDVAAIIRRRDISEGVRIEMLRLVQHGRLVDCLDTVLEIFADAETSDTLKIYAVAALRDIATQPYLLRLWGIIEKHSSISTMICAYLCEALYPKIIDATGLVTLIRKSVEVRRHSVDLPYHLRRHLENVLTPDVSGVLLINLVELCQLPPHIKSDKKEVPISNQFYWIGEILPTVLTHLFNKPSLTGQEIDATAQSLWLIGRLTYNGTLHKDDLKTNLNNLTMVHPAVRRRYFWYLVEKREKKMEDDLTHPIHIFSYFDVLKPMPADLEWAIDDIKNCRVEAERIVSLKLAVDLWYMSGSKRFDRQRIRSASVGDASLLKLFKKLAVNGPLVQINRLWYRYFKYKIAEKWWWKRRLEPLRQKYWWLRWQWALLLHIRLLSSGHAVSWLSVLVSEAGSGDHSHWAPQSWDKLVQKRGRMITRAAKTGCKRLWRTFTPLLPHEKPDPSQTAARVVLGLAGLQAAIADNELNFAKLSEEEARLAVRYAVNELNGFAPWLPDLAKQRPEAVHDVLSECIHGEWQFDAKRERVQEVLSDLVWHGDGFTHLVRNNLLEQLAVGDPPNIKILETVLTLLLREPEPPAVLLAGMTADRVNKYSTDRQGFILWLAVWLQISAEPALKYLQQILLATSDPDSLMISLCSSLHDDSRHRYAMVPTPDYVKPIYLRTLIPLVYRHVRPKEDIDRSGGSYSPTGRDPAQEFRGNLLNLLSQSESTEADDVLKELLQEPILADLHDYILRLIDNRTEQQADLLPWSPHDVRDFAKQYEIDPKSDHDLFKIACRRLLEIKHDVEKADNSIRYDMNIEHEERIFRIWLARKLRERARDRYTVPQEEEIDRRERPDLRIERPGMAPISIEIKWAENYTLPVLLERLENQLAGQYLRDNNSRYGIYLLGYIGKKNKRYWEEPQNHTNRSFEQVVKILEDRAKAIVGECRDVEDIAVIAIDFTEFN